MDKKTITIYDIAKEADVSPATVSRVLTNSTNVSAAKREKIEAIIKKYDFRPNRLARGLSDTKTKVIGIIVADIRNPFYASVFVECERAANRRGYTLLLSNSFGEPTIEEDLLQKLYERRVDAIILMGGRVDEVISDANYVAKVTRISNKIPVIITGKLDGSDCYQVCIDEKQSMRALMEYLINLGHQEIVLIGGRKDVKSTYDKQLTFVQELNKHGIAFNENYILESGSYDEEGGYQCMNKLFDNGEKPSVIIAINDFTASGVIRSITEHGLNIPEDLSVASFDNTFVSQMSIPKLTSVAYDYREFGDKLISTAIEVINGEEVSKIQFVESKLCIRDSCLKKK